MLAFKQQLLSGGVGRRSTPVGAPLSSLRALPAASQSSAALLPAAGPSPRAGPAHAAAMPSRARRALHVCAAATKQKEKAINVTVSVSVEELSAVGRRVTITVPAAVVKAVFKRGVQRIERDVVGTLRGWQAGKPLPLSMVVTQCGGQARFKTFCLEELLLEALPKGIEAARDGRAVDPASVQVPPDAFPAMLQSYDPARDFTFAALFDVAPPVVWRTPLEQLSVTIRDTGDFSTDAAAADDLIRQYRKQHGFSRVVAGRGLALGDTLVMDMEVRSAASGQALPGLVQSRMAFDTEQDALGLTQGMLGMQQGEARTLKLTLPEDYSVEFWKGMKVNVSVRVHEMFEWTVPEFDDAYVAAHHAGKWGSAAEMREALIASTAMQRVAALDKELEDEVVKVVSGALDMPEVPPRMVETLGERQFQMQLMNMINDRVADRADIERLATEEMLNEFVAERKSELEDAVRFNLAVDDIFASKGLALDEEAVAAEMALRVQQMEAVQQPYDKEELLEDVRETVKSVTVIEWLKDNIKRHVVPYNAAAPDDAGAAAAAQPEAAAAAAQ